MKKNRWFIILLAAIMMAVNIPYNIQTAEAASKYIKVEDFIKYIVKKMDWEIDENSEQPYIDVAYKKGILNEGDFEDYSEYLTRTDCAVIANRLDELIHPKYGYPHDVCEFLKDCNLFEGRLYYDINGKLYPEGKTVDTYDARNFKEIITPFLRDAFPSETWGEQGLRTLYEDIYDRNGNIIKTFIMIGLPSPDRANVVEILPFDDNSEIIKLWNYIKDNDRKEAAVLEKRISDIKDIPKSKREAVASIIAKGIIKGYSNGMYIQNREFRGNNKITASGAKDVIQKVLHPEKRALISPDGQLIRTTNLPKNAADYKYILECFPNEFYEMKYSFMFLTDYLSGEIKKDDYAYPKDVDYEYLYNKFYHYQMKLGTDKYDLYDDALLKAEKYMQHIFNVDYRTVDEKWKEGLASTIINNHIDKRIYNRIDDYIKTIRSNQVIVESEKISVEPSTMYDSRGWLYVRVYVKYKVTAKNLNVSPNQLIFNASNSIENIKNGQWRYGYYDIILTSSYNIWGITMHYGISDYFFDETFKKKY
jgi:hypothetical protein